MKKTAIFTGTLITSLLAGQTAFASSYTVQKGDTLWNISNQYHTTVETLMQMNGLTSDLIFPGQTLKVSEKEDTYVVKKGDTLSEIANQFHITVDSLLQMNPGISDPNFIREGQIVYLAKQVSSSAQSTAPSSANGYYIVKEGDTLSGIAAKFQTTIRSLLALNPQIANPNLIRAGQSIKVAGQPVSVAEQNQAVSSSTAKNEQPQKVSYSNEKVSADPVQNNTKPTTLSLADKIIQIGEKYLGAKYLYGASPSRTDAFDCSSFTMRVFSEAGIALPRSSSAQAQVGTPISISQLQKGDLLFFDTDFNGTINHVGIYAGGGQMLNATTSKGVTYVSINMAYWQERFVKAVRVLN
ncbi:spore coat assembly SafA domain protein [Anoxybacillus sp. B7M1]|uniref:C40 family peptidase n=1 Tax=unclassified Anoxybacillus TaxID=2639704 RepID=UPI0005CD9F31|nr:MULTISPECIES: C40 family peptidase [unclassified Anoxybacillus]ANB57683.1 spore coat assembly SafA domain protein [Anoxybacillus sp. B2M1]ANB64185.1 spore coat assembly SafA domain protein [Anoxybacillus sp. B7M1]